MELKIKKADPYLKQDLVFFLATPINIFGEKHGTF